MKEEDKEYLDGLDDEAFLALLYIRYAIKLPIWERCSKEEYENNHNFKFTVDSIEDIFDKPKYRRVPIYHNGGGILDQISYREPDGYYYEKLVEYKDVLMLGSDMIDYCKTRECMKPFLDRNLV